LTDGTRKSLYEKRLAGDGARAPNTDEVMDMRRKAHDPK
jgi:hypothetical protein